MGSKVSTLDCSVAAPFVCGYNPNPMPQYPAYGMRPGGFPMGGMGPGGMAMPAPGGPNAMYPNYGPPMGAPAPGGPMEPPQYDAPESPDYGVSTTATDVSTDQIATEETDGGGGSPVLYLLIIALICCAFFAYRYWKKNYAQAPEEAPKAPPVSKTDTTPLSTAGGDSGKNVMGWKPPDDGPALPPKSFDNPVFREHHQAQEEIEAREFGADELPPGMTMEDPRNPNQNLKKSKRGERGRYHDDQSHHTHRQ